MGEKISGTGLDRKSAAEMMARAIGLPPDDLRSAMETVDAHKYGWSLEVSGPAGRVTLTRYGKGNYTVKSR